jgi:hypothetical protein
MTARTGQSRQASLNRTALTGLSGQNKQDRAARTGQLGQDSQESITRIQIKTDVRMERGTDGGKERGMEEMI